MWRQRLLTLTFVPVNLRVHFYIQSHLSCCPVATMATNPMAIAYDRCCFATLINLGRSQNQRSNCLSANHPSAETIVLGPIRRYTMHTVMLKSCESHMYACQLKTINFISSKWLVPWIVITKIATISFAFPFPFTDQLVSIAVVTVPFSVAFSIDNSWTLMWQRQRGRFGGSWRSSCKQTKKGSIFDITNNAVQCTQHTSFNQRF